MDGGDCNIYTQNETGKLEIYRPITLINIIYKKRASIMTARLNHVLNLLTVDNQYAYKSKKSTIDILSAINNQVKEEGAMQLVLF